MLAKEHAWPPPPELEKIVDVAATMATKLWIDPKMSDVFKLAMTEWKKLMDDPLGLLKDCKRKSRLGEQNKHADELEEA